VREVARRAADVWNVSFASVSPMNEATAPWWVADGTQEGCHFSTFAKAQAVLLLRHALRQEGFHPSHGHDGELSCPVVAAFDENSYDDALDAWKALSPAAKELVGQV
jgi:galactan endo-1,6-beta-galactosidase